jgi:hypothetical protein
METIPNFWKEECCRRFMRTFCDRRFRSLFGVPPVVCATVWSFLSTNKSIPNGAEPERLLWMLYFLKVYPTYDVMASTLKMCPKRLREGIHSMLVACYSTMKDLKLVCISIII